MDRRAELNSELRKARGWLIGVGIFMFVLDMVFVYGVQKDELPSEWKTRITLISAGIMCTFFGLAWLTSRKPRLGLILGLVVFWGIHIVNAAVDPKTLTQGIVLKIFFTLALVRGLKNASRAEDLREELGRVFE